LTGRAREFNTLNTFNGMSRFVSRSESKHDIIDASHAGTSLSIGLGLAITEKLNKKKNYVISVIGNGSLCEGIFRSVSNLNIVKKKEWLKKITFFYNPEENIEIQQVMLIVLECLL
jgi:1-deoxy-D-xylulose-5-phosphate synthase